MHKCILFKVAFVVSLNFSSSYFFVDRTLRLGIIVEDLFNYMNCMKYRSIVPVTVDNLQRHGSEVSSEQDLIQTDLMLLMY